MRSRIPDPHWSENRDSDLHSHDSDPQTFQFTGYSIDCFFILSAIFLWRYAAKRFRKAQCPIVERLVNSLMMHGRNTGRWQKKLYSWNFIDGKLWNLDINKFYLLWQICVTFFSLNVSRYRCRGIRFKVFQIRQVFFRLPRISDPDPDWIRTIFNRASGSGSGFGIRIRDPDPGG